MAAITLLFHHRTEDGVAPGEAQECQSEGPRSEGPKECHRILPMRGCHIQALCSAGECDHSLALSFSRPTINNEVSSALPLA